MEEGKKNSNLKRFMASLLAVVMLFSVVGISTAVFADDAVAPELKANSGEVIIKSGMTNDEVAQILNKALISNYDELDDATKASLQWEYYCEGKNGLLTNDAWGSINGFTSTKKIGWKEVTYTHAALKDADDGVYKLRLAGTTTEVTIDKFSKYTTEVKLNEGASITYNMDASVMEEAIVNNMVNFADSKLPEGVTASDFTVEYYGSYVDSFKVEHNAWVSIAGGRDGFYDYSQMGAGEQKIRVSFNGNAEYKPCSAAEYTLTVNKADVKVTINDPIKIMYAGEAIDSSEYVSIAPKDPALDVYIVYVGVNTNKQTTVYLQLTGNKEDFVNGINALLKYFDLPALNDGMTVGEFKAAVNKALSLVDNELTEALVNLALKDYGLTYQDLKDLMEALNKITIADDLLFAIGAPSHAGQYFATAIAVNDNYNTGTSTPGSVTVLKNWTGIKLAKNPILDSNDNKITVSQAEALKAGNDLCILTKEGAALDSTSVGSIHYWFTGVGKLYAKSTMPTAPGKYIVTASVRGGDFFAMPKTFTFTIVADPTPEVTPEA